MMKLRVDVVPVTHLQQNCTILSDEESGRGVVIDPGGDLPLLRSVIDGRGISIDRIILTHGHLDHAGGATELSESLGVEIIGPHEDDMFLLRSLAAQGEAFDIQGVRDCRPDLLLRDGDSVDLAGLSFEVLHCPGHTPGHVVFVNHAIKCAIVGDVLFKGSVGRTDFPYGDHEMLMTSIRTKLMPLDDDVRCLCGHGESSTIGEERAHNPFLRGL